LSEELEGADKRRRAVVVGCARDCERYLPAALQKCERIASVYGQVEFVFVENDSADKTKAMLKAWLASGHQGRLIELDGLAARNMMRTDRIAAARNAYLDEIRNSELREFDHLVTLDMDAVNARAIDLEAFRAAVEFLDSAPETAGVFASATPVYYDIWALRQETWCPTDCWTEIEDRPWWMSKRAAGYKYIYARQFAIPCDAPPIRVSSAFGGLGVYKMTFALEGNYCGRHDDGRMACEHVAFNEAIGQKGGVLYIFPRLQNQAPLEHTIWGRRLNHKNALYKLRYRLMTPSPSSYNL
jgi:hypothetical protein